MKKSLRLVLALVCVAVFLFAGFQLGKTLLQRWEAARFYDFQQLIVQLQPTQAPTQEPSAPTAGTTPAQETEEPTRPPETAPIQVDFTQLCQTYPDCIGWIYSPDTPISYPVVQSENNGDYLYHLPDGTYNPAGSIFADYRNGPVGEDQNFILYGHHMKDGTMFASLNKYKEQAYYEAHPVLYFLTSQGDYKITLLAGATVDADSDIYLRNFPTQAAMDWQLASLQEQSTFRASLSYERGMQLITLSTCTYEYDDARYVVVGVLEKLD